MADDAAATPTDPTPGREAAARLLDTQHTCFQGDRVQAVLPGLRKDLEDLVRIESVSADPERASEVIAPPMLDPSLDVEPGRATMPRVRQPFSSLSRP